jgi:anti-sigma B factor antagonist
LQPSKQAHEVPDPFTVYRSRHEREVVLALVGELDLATVDRLKAALEEVEQAPPDRLVIDLSRLSFLDSTGLAALALDKRCQGNGRPALEIRPGPPAVQRLFKLVGAAERLPFRDGSVANDALPDEGRASGPGSAVP